MNDARLIEPAEELSTL